MATEASIQDPWDVAFQSSLAKLSVEDRTIMLSTPTYEALRDYMENLQRTNSTRLVTKLLARIQGLLLNLKDFAGAIDTAVQSNPAIAALIWGGMKLVIELAVKFSATIELVAQALLDLDKTLSRFDVYTKLFPTSLRLNSAMASFYESVVNLSVSIISFLRRSPIRNIFASLWGSRPRQIADSIKKVEHHSRLVDLESAASKMEVDDVMQKQIHALLTKLESPLPPIAKTPCYHLPTIGNSAFFAREDELEACRVILSSSASRDLPCRLALYGIGGVGKTSIARQFAANQVSKRAVILWLASDDKIRLLQSYSDAAKSLGLPDSSPVNQREAVKSFLASTSEPWLVIFDNVESGDDLEDSLPIGQNGAILFTSRNAEIHHGLQIEGLEIKPFDNEQGRDFLLQFLPRADRLHDTHEAEKLAERLGGLALGIKQIASYLRESGMSISELLQVLDDKESERRVFDDRSGFVQLGYRHTLSTAWEISLSRLGNQGRTLLDIISLLDPEEIQISFLKELWINLGEGELSCSMVATLPTNDIETTTNFFSNLGILTRYGLLEQKYEARSVGTHRLIQATTLHTMDPEQQRILATTITETIFNDFPHAEISGQALQSHWSICARYTPHILQLQQLIRRYRIPRDSGDKLWSLVFNCSRYLVETGRMLQGEEVAKGAEYLCDIDSKEGLIQLSFLQTIYGVVAVQHQQHAAATDWFQKAYQIRKKYLGETSQWTMSLKLNLGLAMLNERRFPEVIAFYADDPEHGPWIGAAPMNIQSGVYDQLAISNCELGNLDTAWAQTEKLLSLLDQMPSHDRTGGMYTAGKIRAKQGLLDEALQYFMASLEARKKNQGDHIQTAAVTYQTGDVLARLGRLDEAIAMLEETRRIWGVLKVRQELSRGGKARLEWRLSTVLKKAGRDDKAEILSRQALQELEALRGVVKEDATDKDFDLLVNQMDA
ncbi:hypothetical protein GGR58DRAFT_481512 [Xylaria digitata]|nr:hypothetical protein GGR58DRAFT_481512 [Xylaria digitata]